MSDDVRILLRFDEPVASVLPADAAGNLGDMNVADPATMGLPQVADAFAGFGRVFEQDAALSAVDVVPGTTLLNRSVTIQALLRYDLDAHIAYDPATLASIVMRGLDGSAAEYIAFGLELRIVNTALRVVELRMRWQTVAGATKVQTGGHFIVPVGQPFLLLTAVRRYVSATEVWLDYYCGSQRIASVMSVDGDIGGGTTGHTLVGARRAAGLYGDWFWGTIDELRVLNREMSQEEVEATWLRLSSYQPLGLALIHQVMPPGWPFAMDPDTRIGREDRAMGHALGYAAAQSENVRANLMPDRAWGNALVAWERITGQVAKPQDSIARRRARVVAHLRQRSGVSIPGVAEAMAELLSLAPSQFEILSFSPTVNDDFTTLNTLQWYTDIAAQWTISAGALRVQAAGGANILFDGATRNSYHALLPCVVEGIDSRFFQRRGLDAFVKFIPTTLPASSSSGIVVLAAGESAGASIFFGLRNNGGTYQVVSEIFGEGTNPPWVSSGVTVHATTSLTTHWFHLFQKLDGTSKWTVRWSTTGPTSGFSQADIVTTFVPIQPMQWFGFSARASIASLGSALDVKFDDAEMRAPHSRRAFNWYVFRDPLLPGTYDLVGADRVFQRMKQAHTRGTVVTAKSVLCDSLGHGCDENPMGGI